MLASTPLASPGGTEIAEPRSRVLTSTVSMPPLAEFHVNNLAMAFRAAATAGTLSYRFRRIPAGDRPWAAYMGNLWRVHTGGVLLATRLPKSYHIETPMATDLPRAVAILDDPRVAREALALDQTWIRRTAWLQKTNDGKWAFRMRWDNPAYLTPRASGYGHTYWTSKSRGPRRWVAAPPERPRNTQGKPVSTRQAVKLIGLIEASRLLRVKS